MQIRFLNLTSDGIYLLGRPLKLSPTEERLLRAIAEGGKSGVDDLLPLLSEGVSRGNIAVHITSINNKATMLKKPTVTLFPIPFIRFKRLFVMQI